MEGEDYVVSGQEMSVAAGKSRRFPPIWSDICLGFCQRLGHSKEWEEMGQ